MLPCGHPSSSSGSPRIHTVYHTLCITQSICIQNEWPIRWRISLRLGDLFMPGMVHRSTIQCVNTAYELLLSSPVHRQTTAGPPTMGMHKNARITCSAHYIECHTLFQFGHLTTSRWPDTTAELCKVGSTSASLQLISYKQRSLFDGCSFTYSVSKLFTKHALGRLVNSQ